MALVEAAAADALFARIGSLVLSPNLPIAWPNVAFTPPQTAYLAVAFLPNRTDNLGVGDLDHARHQGLLQITVVAPVNGGIAATLRTAGAIVAHFPKGTTITRNGVSIRVTEKPSIAPAFQDGERLRVPVTVRWHSFNR